MEIQNLDRTTKQNVIICLKNVLSKKYKKNYVNKMIGEIFHLSASTIKDYK